MRRGGGAVKKGYWSGPSVSKILQHNPTPLQILAIRHYRWTETLLVGGELKSRRKKKKGYRALPGTAR